MSARQDEPGVCQYLCFREAVGAHYIAVNMFRDLFGDGYAKPLYIERTERTELLAEHCEERVLRGMNKLK